MSVLGPIFWVIVLLGVMIVVHEAGHYWAALAIGVRVDTFSLGFGPRLFGFRRGDTDFRVSAIPFGGYVRVFGDQPLEQAATELDTRQMQTTAARPLPAVDPKSLQAKARWQRAIFIVAGPLMNVLLAIGIVAGLYMYGYAQETREAVIAGVAPGSAAAEAGLRAGDKVVRLGDKTDPSWQDLMMTEAMSANHAVPLAVLRKGERIETSITPRLDPKTAIGVAGWRGDVQVGEVSPNSPAAQAGIQPGDTFLNANGQPVDSFYGVQQTIIRSNGQPVTLELLRNGQSHMVTVTPIKGDSARLPWRIGIAFRMPTKIVKLGLFPALAESINYNRQSATMIFEVLRGIVAAKVSPKVLSGPVGMAEMSSQAAHEGASVFLGMMASVSLNLAIFNLLPIPILDGGTLLLLLIEMVMQREISIQAKENVLKLGFVFLMMLVVFAMYNDISRILTRG